MLNITYRNARTNFPKWCDKVTNDREIVVIKRCNGENVALIAADELEALIETAHLLRSPKNAQRLLASLKRALCRQEDTALSADLSNEADRYHS